MPAVRVGTRKKFGESLNGAQREAATYGERTEGRFRSGPLLILAGAGTGKTMTLANRVAYLLLKGVSPDRILLMTFTRRAAQEMVSRAETIIKQTRRGRRTTALAKLRWAGTFHSVGQRLLREYAHAMKFDPGFQIIDESYSADLMDIVRQELGFAKHDKRFPQKGTCQKIYSTTVNKQLSLKVVVNQFYPWCAEHVDDLRSLFGGYVAAKQEQNVMDYDDLLLFWHLLLQDPGLAEQMGARFDHVLVDEYQDTNTLQGEILLGLKPEGNGLCVVGDDAQSIYAFRGAAVANIRKFPEQFTPPAHIIKLEQNYRSEQPILDTANALMREASGSFEKNLRSEHQSQQKPHYVKVMDEQTQACYVAEQILAAREEGIPLHDQAALIRNSRDSGPLELKLLARDIPFEKYGGSRFIDAAHVQDVLSILRFIDNPKNNVAAFRAMQLMPGMGSAYAARCFKKLKASGFQVKTLASFNAPRAAAAYWPAFAKLIAETSAADVWTGQMTQVRHWYSPHLKRLHDSPDGREEDLDQLEAMSAQYNSRLAFLTELTLDPPQASRDVGPAVPDEDCFVISTIHSAKGKEWQAVYLLNVVDGVIPSAYALGDVDAVEEERRTLYVALTRAKRNLHVLEPIRSHMSDRPVRSDGHVYGTRSRFMSDAVLRTFERTSWPRGTKARRLPRRTRTRIDARAKMRSMWES